MLTIRSCCWLVAAVIAMGGCTYRVFSPPARAFPIEGPRPLPPGRTSISGEIGSAGAFEVLGSGPSLHGGTLQVAHGLTHGEISGEVSWLSVDGNSTAGTNPNIGTLRTGYRVGNQVVGVEGGIGGGVSAAGTFVSPDLGVILGREGCLVTPSLALRAWLSVPLDARPTDVSGNSQPPGSYVLTPHLTFGFGPSVGLRIPIGPHDCSKFPSAPAALFLGVAVSKLNDRDGTMTFVSAAAGVTFVF
jgi:hypothetical protein